MHLTITGEIWFWRGPAPHHFVTVPPAESDQVKAASSAVTYGWGMIPVTVQAGDTRWTTSLFPKDGLYIVPIKAAVRAREHLGTGQQVTLTLEIDA